eukprot:4337866-Prymnesium_polylepis.1
MHAVLQCRTASYFARCSLCTSKLFTSRSPYRSRPLERLAAGSSESAVHVVPLLALRVTVPWYDVL